MQENLENCQYDLAVIGAGPGGYPAAIRAAQHGAKVALIEKEKLGGTCLNRGCIPTKALLASANLIEKIKHSEEFGVEVRDFSANFTKVVERKNKIVQELCDGIAGLQKAWKNDVFMGHGKIIGGDADSGFKILIQGEDEKIIEAKRIIIATGSSPALIKNFNVDHKRILTSDDILNPNFKNTPERLLIIGAGVIGCEFAEIFVNFGCKVTMLEMLPTPLATEEPIIIKQLEKKFKALGIKIFTSQRVLSIESNDSGVKAITCDVSTPEDQLEIVEKSIFEADQCLISIGRKKESSDLVEKDLGMKFRRGAIEVDPYTLETKVKGIYAIGDVTGGMMLAHVATYEGFIAVSNALSSLGNFEISPQNASNRVVPATIFTHPNIASVGLKRKQARNLGIEVLIGQFPYQSLGKAKCIGAEGLLMILADKNTLQIIGASCIGEGAPELISEIALAMQNGLTTEDITSTIHSHPTLSEMVLEAAEAVVGKSIHKKGRPILPSIRELLIGPLIYEIEKLTS